MDDFEEARETGARVALGDYSTVGELPDGAVQMYTNDPAGDLVEVNWPDANTLDGELVGKIREIDGPPEAALYATPERSEARSKPTRGRLSPTSRRREAPE